MTDQCATANRLWYDWRWANEVKLKAYFLRVYREHRKGCPKCKQRMSEFTELARTANMPEMEE